jgi:hypothetical protein
MIAARIRSPLRWLWAFIGSLSMLALAGLTGIVWIAFLVPVVVALFLVAPPLGIFKHDERIIPRTSLALTATETLDAGNAPGGAPLVRYTLSLRNDGEVDAHDFSVRLLVPDAISPRNGVVKPLGRIHRGKVGKHWFTESAYDATALTFRTRIAPGDDVVCRAGESIDIAELHFVQELNPYGSVLDYQVSGGSAKAALGQLRLE